MPATGNVLRAPVNVNSRSANRLNKVQPHARRRTQCVATGPSHRQPAVSGTPSQPPQGTVIPFKIPKSLQEVDNGQILGFGADLAEGHPGYHDLQYKQRRADIATVACSHTLGQPIPRVDYTPEESAVWAKVMQELQPLYQRHACEAFLRTYPLFGFTPDKVPQLQDLHDVLQRTSGWQIRPTAGLLHPRDFLAGLAFKCFHSTQYIRHPSKPSYTPEPDIIHEALGHVPMLADPGFCDLVHNIGIASLGADDKTIWNLTKIYWYTVEFGVIREHGEIKAFGAGVLSSYGEMKHMASGTPTFERFDPFAKLPAMRYKDGYQNKYFVLESFADGAARIKKYCEHVHQGLAPEVKEAVMKVKEAVA